MYNFINSLILWQTLTNKVGYHTSRLIYGRYIHKLINV